MFEKRGLVWEASEDPEIEELTATALNRKLNNLSILPHVVVRNGADTALTPSEMDPGFYDGPDKYKMTPRKLQDCLQKVMKDTPRLAHISVALVDLTKDINKPEFAGHLHDKQKFVASVAKIAPMLGAFQLRKDVRVAFAQKKAASLTTLFDAMRDDWAATQVANPKLKDVRFTKSITLRDKLVLLNGWRIPLTVTKAPQLTNVFSMPTGGGASTIDFQSTGESKTQLNDIATAFDLAFDPPKGDKRTYAQLTKDRRDNKALVDALGFLERLRLAIGGVVPTSNYCISTIVRDVGYAYIASTLLQSGLHDPARGGGLWLGSDYWSGTWRWALVAGVPQSATAGSLAALMTLMKQDRLVDAQSSADMRALLQKTPNPTTHPTIKSLFKEGLREKIASGLLRSALSKLGVFGGDDDCTYLERKMDSSSGATILRYVAVGLRARTGAELKDLIKLLDDCIVANNTP